MKVGDGCIVESILDESAVLAESGPIWKVGYNVVPAHPSGMGESEGQIFRVM